MDDTFPADPAGPALLASGFEDAPVALALTSSACVLLRVNGALCGLLGRTAADLVGRDLFGLTHPEDRSAAELACGAFGDGQSGHTRVECRLRHADGHHIVAQVNAVGVPASASGGGPAHVVVHIEDAGERLAEQAELSRQALHDALTSLPNRALFGDRLAQAVSRSSRDGTPLAVLFCDLDRFKAVNDRLGHDAGDEVLVQLAARLRRLLRPGDTAARLGGDEFTVLCEGADRAEAERIAGRLAAAAAEPFHCDGELVALTLSVGIVTSSAGALDPATLLRHADLAMYAAKARGRGQHATFDDTMSSSASSRRSTDKELRRALDEGELRLHYQPIVDLHTGRRQGVEALVRWQHPRRGLLLPGAFVPVAEDRGLIVPLGHHVLREAAEQACRWAAAGEDPTVMWVNVSARQLVPELVAFLRELLARAALPPAALGLEITESVLMSDLQAVTPLLDQLRGLGVRLAIDDFGTGYSSLAYLAQLPVDTVKVDQSFTARLGPGGNGAAVITAVLALAGSLGLDTVVEGVQTQEQSDVLRELGVVNVQGHLFGAPGPPW